MKILAIIVVRQQVKELLNIAPPKNRQHILWEHSIKSVFGALITYAILFFVPMIMFGRKNASDWMKQKGENIFRYLDEHPEFYIYCCLITIFIISVFTHLKNRKRKYIFRINQSEDSFELGISNLYYQRTEMKTLKKSSVKILIISSTNDMGKKSIVRFMNSEFSYPIGEIRIDHVLYHKMNRKVVSVIKEIEKTGTIVERVNGKSRNIGGSVLRGITGWK